MTDEAMIQEQSASKWSALQVGVMAALCLGVGMLIGYLLHSPAGAQASAPAPAAGQAHPGGPPTMPTLDQLRHMADKQAESLLQQLQKDPKNPELLMKIAYVYKAAHQFQKSAAYFDRVLQITPNNVTARTEMASCLYYGGDPDGAIAQLQKSLTYDPKHAGTLFNLGMIRWKGKRDAEGAIAAWEKILQLYPKYERKATIEKLIADARQQGGTRAAVQTPKD